MMTWKYFVAGGALSALVLMQAPARADTVFPEEAACQGKKEGTECDLEANKKGRCTPSKCTRLDYENWDKDASAVPPTISVDCLLCLEGDGGAPANDGGNEGPTTTRADEDGGSGGSATNGSTDGGGCSVARGAARTVGPWLLAAAVPLLLRRRRSRSTTGTNKAS